VAGTLFLVGTPIGNLGDLTDRARRTLAEVGLIACEDTRRTGRLLAGLGIKARLLSFFEGNEAERMPQILEQLRAGTDVAVVSDAGMPSLSDPGYRLVAACVDAGIRIDVIPGPSAAVAALVISGLPTDRFVFEGFLPRSGKARADRLASLEREPRTVVLFESPRRVAATLQDLLAAVGDRRVVVARELTKLHQEVIRGLTSEVLGQIRGRELKGEVVLVLEGATGALEADPSTAAAVAAELVAGGLRKREAAREASRRTGVPAGKIYAELVERS
jgi:16S rRNA (cytidine1402-2'-O)-methyltransferase